MTAILEEQGLIRLPDAEALQEARAAILEAGGSLEPHRPQPPAQRAPEALGERLVWRWARRLVCASAALAAARRLEGAALREQLGAELPWSWRGAAVIALWAGMEQADRAAFFGGGPLGIAASAPPWEAVDLALQIRAWDPGLELALGKLPASLDPRALELAVDLAREGLDLACAALLARPSSPEAPQEIPPWMRPEWRLERALEAGGRQVGPWLRRLPCPACGRRSAYAAMAPEDGGWAGAACGHRESCGWRGIFEEAVQHAHTKKS